DGDVMDYCDDGIRLLLVVVIVDDGLLLL
ncbi:hypothetical protein Tco_0023900, partial [Tanacetum coccineum]